MAYYDAEYYDYGQHYDDEQSRNYLPNYLKGEAKNIDEVVDFLNYQEYDEVPLTPAEEEIVLSMHPDPAV